VSGGFVDIAFEPQLERDVSDNDLCRAWILAPGSGTVALHRTVLVFHGGDVALCEEVLVSP